MKKAVLLLTFNRLEYTKKVFEQIAIAKPPRLYIASDGPRVNKDGERELVENIREYMLENIDWACDVKTRFLETNSGGCGLGVSGAITWFFENEEDGIILEDDCVPNQSFFYFCEELLDYYKDNKRVWHISGDQFVPNSNNNASYYFAKVQHCWGWASWADRWKYYKFNLDDYNNEENIKKISDRVEVQDYWVDVLNRMKRKEVDTWDYQWTFCIVKHNGYCINPSKNLVSNIGVTGVHFDGDALNPFFNIRTFNISKIIHPKKIEYDMYAINYIYENIFFIKKENTPNMIKKRIFLEYIFSVYTEEKFIVIYFFGIKISLKRKSKAITSNKIVDTVNIIPAKSAKCNVCNEYSKYIFKSTILNKYDIEYYFCENCNHIQTEKPYWIGEAYDNAVSITDTGIVQRNIYMTQIISKILFNFFDNKKLFLEYAGGYGLLTRMMRDIGFNFYWSDKYANNIFAKGFEYDGKSKVELLTAIEVFEHLVNPMEEIESMFKISDNILFSQTLLPMPVPKPSDWWYYATATGQHISFYTNETLKYIASKFGKNYVYFNDIHLFTNKKINQLEFEKVCNSHQNISGNMKSKTVDDMYFCIDMIKKN